MRRGRAELRLHVSKHPLQALEFADRTAELFALLHPSKSVIERPGRNSHCAGAGTNALAVVGVHEVRKTSFET
jgi:hypothetical protein